MSETLKTILTRVAIVVVVSAVLLGAMVLLSIFDPVHETATEPVAETAAAAGQGTDVVRDEIVPLASPVRAGRWALVNMLASVFSLALGVWLVADMYTTRRAASPRGGARKDRPMQVGTPWAVAAALLAVAVPVLFLFTQDPAGAMVLTDSMTLWTRALATLQALFVLLMRRARYAEMERIEEVRAFNGG